MVAGEEDESALLAGCEEIYIRELREKGVWRS